MIREVKVWDIFVRIFHWSLVILFVTSYLTGEEETPIHFWSGYAIITLLLARILWGFVGSKYARFSSFVFSPSETTEYIKAIKNKHPRHYLGHNPLGGMMVFAMLFMLVIATGSGIKLLQIEENAGPMTWFSQNPASEPFVPAASEYEDGDDEYEEEYDEYGEHHEEEEEFFEEIHETAVNLLLLLIVIHIGGVIFSSRVHRENLAKSMVTGIKFEDDSK